MEEERAERKNHERPRPEKDAVACRGRPVWARFLVRARISGAVLIDGARGNAEDRRRSQGREDRNHQEHRALRKHISDRAGDDRNRNVARMIERGIATETPGKVGLGRQPQGQSGHRGSEGVAGDRQNAERDRHRPERGKAKDNEAKRTPSPRSIGR